MRFKRSKLSTWLIIYELVYAITFTVTGLMLLSFSRVSPIESISFIKSHNVLNAVMHIWLNNTTSFLITATFVILHPALGIPAVIFASISSGVLFASWLTNHCSLAHFIYGHIETQAYLLLWLIVARTYYVQKECNDLLCKWKSTLNQTSKLILYAFVTFFTLSIIEVVEVHVFG